MYKASDRGAGRDTKRSTPRACDRGISTGAARAEREPCGSTWKPERWLSRGAVLSRTSTGCTSSFASGARRGGEARRAGCEFGLTSTGAATTLRKLLMIGDVGMEEALEMLRDGEFGRRTSTLAMRASPAARVEPPGDVGIRASMGVRVEPPGDEAWVEAP